MDPRSLAYSAGSVVVLVFLWLGGAAVFAWQAATPSPLNPGALGEAVEAVAAVVEREYFDPKLAARMAQTLRTRSSQGEYAAVETWGSLAKILTRDLFQLSKDKHLDVRLASGRAVARNPLPDNAREVRARRTNYGVQRVEVLAGNVGYLNLTFFYRPEEAVDTLAAAMRLLRSTDALIVDMRENGGGSPETVAALLSYFFDAVDLPLFEIVPRGEKGRRYSTGALPVADRNPERLTYVLTAAGTFSGGEGFPFILQERRRALVVGEQTAGAANPGRPYPAGSHFEVTVPNGQVRTAVAGGNWEGHGVKPDVAVPASDALRVAHIHALRERLKVVENGPWREALRGQLRLLEQLANKR